MKYALVTGANKGIGLETAKLLSQREFVVYLGSRDLKKGLAAVEKLTAEGLSNIVAVQLDVTSQQSVDAARKTIGERGGVLDVLINNAGISGEYGQTALASKPDQYQTVYETNVFGIVRVTQAFIDLLKQSPEPRIVNVTTAMASLTLAGDIFNDNFPQRFTIYQSSKSALNMYTVNLAYELRETPFKVNAVCPGYTRTDFTNHQGTSTAEQAAQRITRYALIGSDGPTGKYFSEEYFTESVCPW